MKVLAEGTFPGEEVPRTQAPVGVKVKIDNRDVDLVLVDTPTDEAARLRLYKGAGAVMLCYSILSQSSASSARARWKPELARHLPDVPVVLVGTKLDLRDDRATLEAMRREGATMVSYDEGEAIAREIRAQKFCQLSALTTTNTRWALESAGRLAPPVTPRLQPTLPPAASARIKKG